MAIKVWGAGTTQGSDKNWNTATNWDSDTLPVDGDSILFDGTAVNYLQYGPSSHIYIENVELTSACELNLNGCIMDYTSQPLLIFGSLINNSFINYSNPVYTLKPVVYLWAWGITSVVGAWAGYLTPVVGVTPDVEIYFNGNQVFNASNNIDLIRTSSMFTVAIRNGVGSSGTSVGSTGPINQITFEDVNLDYTAVYKIEANTIILKGVNLIVDPTFYYNGMGEFEFTCSTLTIQESTMPNYNGFITTFYTNMGTPSVAKLALKVPCVINVEGNWGGIPFNKDLPMLFYGNSSINLYSNSAFYGTNESFSGGMQPSKSYALLLRHSSSYVTITINAYNDSKLVGLFYASAFKDCNSSPYLISDSLLGLLPEITVFMRNNSMFIGSVGGQNSFYGASKITFLDSSNINFDYSTNVSSNPTTYPGDFYPNVGLSTPISEAIPQTQTGLTIFKSSF